MLTQLTSYEARVIGVLLEKEITTPDQYPLSLNGLTLGCNQKSNREPVMALSESEVQAILEELRAKKLIFEHSGVGSRVVKYKHRFCNTEFSDLKFNRQQLAIVCVLLLRGPQTPGELRTRTQRLAEFTNNDEVETNLAKLQDLNNQQLVVKLDKEPGKRDSRFAHLFSGEQPATVASTFGKVSANEDHGAKTKADSNTERIESLEEHVADLTRKLAELTELVEILSE